MAAWLFKTEPSDYAFADLVRDRRAVWEGISNALALIHLRKVKKGDVVVIYHTGAEKRAVGLAYAAGDPYTDPKLKDPKRAVVDLSPGQSLPSPVPLATFKTDLVLRATELVRNSRLSVMPLSDVQLARLLQLAGAWTS
ncbi:MAG: EVE domain-containing protein [Candidatus Eisenbacteria bacterium]|nr:EVE domain-containing protein [Candidatus Eisenbacteria bacterium]